MGNLRSCSVFLMALFVIAILSTDTGAQAQTPDSAEWVAAHNTARQQTRAGLPPLIWNNGAYYAALAWARNRAARPGCPFDHSGTQVYGENIFWSSGNDTPPSSVVGLWASEKLFYDYRTNSCASGKECGHYTQVVWKATTSVGCASVLVPAWTCDGYKGGRFYVCNYYPPGNVVGKWPY